MTTQDRKALQQTPLSDDQLTEMFLALKDNLPDMWASGKSTKPFFEEFARLIEKYHEIGV